MQTANKNLPHPPMVLLPNKNLLKKFLVQLKPKKTLTPNNNIGIIIINKLFGDLGYHQISENSKLKYFWGNSGLKKDLSGYVF